MRNAAGSAYPEHPDNYGYPGRGFYRDDRDDAIFGELAPDVTEEEADAMWEEEQVIRKPSVHRHACGHDCFDGGCVFFAATRDYHCAACARRFHLI